MQFSGTWRFPRPLEGEQSPLYPEQLLVNGKPVGLPLIVW